MPKLHYLLGSGDECADFGVDTNDTRLQTVCSKQIKQRSAEEVTRVLRQREVITYFGGDDSEDETDAIEEADSDATESDAIIVNSKTIEKRNTAALNARDQYAKTIASCVVQTASTKCN
ncbi:uncharacterized protein LOC107264870 [Cephus cinctus]|uniref:Uncharacterized protein LOC107264870 n=1 Tax=Cephus cinctus TaxID=211228 RepID=A0AAJ7BLM3_CEPCN|nr:uncharacterized protein LOC107264870 [Cephus cinctus]